MGARIICIFIWWLTGFLRLSAQQPAYSILGENQLRGLKVYDIIQDNQFTYYIATNEGILAYDFIKFTKIDIKEAKSFGFFNFTKNKFGTIYFNNLNNQIFELKNGTVRFFYELDKTQSANLIHLNNDEKGNLMIACKGLIVLSPEGKTLAKTVFSRIIHTSYLAKPNTWIFPATNDTFLVYKDGKINFQKVQFATESLPIYKMLSIVDYGDSTYALDLATKKLYYFQKNNWTFYPLGNPAWIKTGTNARIFPNLDGIWSPYSIAGVNYNPNGFWGVHENYFSDYFISDIYKDHEGNLLFGTFDKGILIVPNLKIKDVSVSASKDPYKSIYAMDSGKLILGSNTGSLYLFQQNKITTLSHVHKKPIEGIYGNPNSPYLIFDDEQIKYLHKVTGKIEAFSGASLKDVAFVDANNMYLASNIGLIKTQIQPNGQCKTEYLSNFHFRIYSVAYFPNRKILMASTANGLFEINSTLQGKIIKFQNTNIYSEKIVAQDNNLYILTQNQGILRLDPSGNIKVIRPKLPDMGAFYKQVQVYKGNLILGTTSGLFLIDTFGKILFPFHSAFGFATKKIYQFSLAQHTLWVSHSGGIQEINLIKSVNQSRVPQVYIKEVWINNKLHAELQQNAFSHDKNKFEFVVYSPTLQNVESIQFLYKLQGYDTAWQVLGANQNTVVYNALMPGNYVFQVKAVNLGLSSEIKTYAFKIQSAFYSRWWFLAILFLVILGGVYFFYKRKLNKLQKKVSIENELNLSKLTAIQSQMNPHFIFNALNSIQDLVLQQQVHKAYDSIGKFALLIRKIMHHSEKEFIDIEEELSMLKVYLEMEQLRLQSDFEYQIDAEEVEDIEIPPMLVQPYIENALKHGLMHKEGTKILHIHMYVEDQKFICEITDNGIGRKKAEEIKQRQQKLHNSFASNALEKRLQILQKHFGGEYGAQIHDLADENGNPTGTKVILTAPFKQKF